MTLNEKTGVILKQHKEGEEFFNAPDFMIKGDRSILEDFLSLRKVRPDASIFETYVIHDGSMGRADKVKSMYRYSKQYGRTTRNLLCPRHCNP